MSLRSLVTRSLSTWTRQTRLAAMVGAYAAYVLLFGPLYGVAGPSSAVLASVPVLLTARLYGALPGLAAAVLCDAVMLPLLAYWGQGGEPSLHLRFLAIPMIGLPLMALGVDWARRLHDRLTDQIAAHTRTRAALERSERLFRSVVEQSGDGIVLIDDAGYVIVWNEAEARITGIPSDEALGAHLAELQFGVLPEGEDTPERHEVLRRRLASMIDSDPSPWFGRHHDRVIRSRDGALHTVESVFFPINLEGRRLLGSTNRDVTEQRRAEALVAASLHEKEVLLREVHHRVKNNLQVIASLLELQSDYISDPTALSQLAEGQQRIRSMALIHESLYRSVDLALVDLAMYVRDLVDQLSASHGIDPDCIRVSVDATRVRLGIDVAIPCGLIINELVSNCLKHAFPNGEIGHIDVSLSNHGSHVAFTVADDGAGLPPELDYRHTRTLGLQLVNLLAAQLDGQVERVEGPGTAFRVTFPLPDERHDQARAEKESF